MLKPGPFDTGISSSCVSAIPCPKRFAQRRVVRSTTSRGKPARAAAPTTSLQSRRPHLCSFLSTAESFASLPSRFSASCEVARRRVCSCAIRSSPWRSHSWNPASLRSFSVAGRRRWYFRARRRFISCGDSSFCGSWMSLGLPRRLLLSLVDEELRWPGGSRGLPRPRFRGEGASDSDSVSDESER